MLNAIDPTKAPDTTPPAKLPIPSLIQKRSLAMSRHLKNSLSLWLRKPASASVYALSCQTQVACHYIEMRPEMAATFSAVQ